jgi:hypothetical protein
VSWGLPSLAPGATSPPDVTVTGRRRGDPAHAAQASSTRFIELDAAAWTTDTVRLLAGSISLSATFGLAAAPLSLAEEPPRERPCAPNASANLRQNVNCSER